MILFSISVLRQALQQQTLSAMNVKIDYVKQQTQRHTHTLLECIDPLLMSGHRRTISQILAQIERRKL
jgi:hypothetical protein